MMVKGTVFDILHVMRKVVILIFIPVLLPVLSMAGSHTYDLNANCMKAYDKIFELRFEEAASILAAERSASPDNLFPVFLENYIDFLSLFISEEDEMFKAAEGNKETRLDLLKKGDKTSPYFLYTQAEIHMQWAFSRIKFGEYIKAFLEVRKAYKLLNENRERFPDFKPNLKSLGVLHTLLGAIPDKYKFGAKMLGMKGSIPQGMEELAAVIGDDDFVFRSEAIIMYALLQLHLNKNETEAWSVISDEGLDPANNLLHCFAMSSVAMYTGRNDEMIRLLENRPSGPEYFPFPYLDFYLGLAKLHRLDDDADIYFKRYIEEYNGKNYIKESYRKLAWFYFLQGKSGLYNYYIQMAALDGEAVSDEDRSAMAEARSGRKPHRELLKARLLFDGAYYESALEIIEDIDAAALSHEWFRVEYNYRHARILDETGRWPEAKQAYDKAIESGSGLPTYFSPNACIKLGLIYEREGNAEEARKYYNRALTFDNHEYKNSIDAEAKAGLNRLKR
jgi:tetratricopeptide (TPR) repeat protein